MRNQYLNKRRFSAGTEVAELRHVRVHSQRHWYAFLAVNASATLCEVQHLLEPRLSSSDLHYAHMVDSGLRRVSQEVSDVMNAAMRQADEAAAVEG